MSILAMILLATLLGGFISMSLAALLAFRLSRGVRVMLIAFAAGVMLSSAWLDILPEAVEAMQQAGAHGHSHGESQFARPVLPVGVAPESAAHAHGGHHGAVFPLFVFVFLGILGFFALEHLALWRHAHTEDGHDARDGADFAAPLVLIGDAFHNFVDGFLIAAAFLADPMLGITTAFAITMHEIPQELGDFVILLHAGYSRRKAFLANAASSLTSLLGGLIGYFFMADARRLLPYVLALAAASFIYIALADLIPMLRHEPGHARRFVRQFSLILLGGAIVPALGLWAHH
jgi:zinc and cadmium transporter